MGDEEEWRKLSVEDKIVNKLWKARLDGYEEATKQFKTWDEDDPKWKNYQGLAKKMVTDTNAVAQEKGLECCLAFAENCKTAPKTAAEVVDGLVLKCVAAPKAKTKELATQLCLMYCEIEAQEKVIEQLLAGFANKNPKVVSGCVNNVTECLRSFGAKAIKISPLLKAIIPLMEHRDKDVREGGKRLIIESYRWIGDMMKVQLKDIKEVVMKELEAEFSNLSDVGKAKPERWLRSQGPPKEVVREAGQEAGEDEEDEEEDSQDSALDPYEMLDPVEILSKLPKDFYEKVEEKKWQLRKEALDALLALTENPKLQPGDFHELVKVLKKFISKDTNVLLVAIACKCMAGLAKGLRNNFKQQANNNLSVCLEKFKEKKVGVVTALRDCVDAFYNILGIEAILEDCLAALKIKTPSVKSETALFLARCFAKCPAVLTTNKKIMKGYVSALLECLNEADKNVRESASKALGALWKFLGEGKVMPFMPDLDKLKLDKIKEEAETIELTGKSAAPKPKKEAAKPAPGPKIVKPSPTREEPPPVTKPSSAPKSKVVKGGAAKAGPKKPASAKAGGGGAPVGGVPSESDLSIEECEARAGEVFSEAIVTGLGDNNWKTRLASMEEANGKLALATEFPGLVAVKLLCKKPGLKDNNFQVLGAKLAAMKTIASKVPVSQQMWDAVTPEVVGILADKKNSESVKEVLYTMAEGSSFNFIFGAVLDLAFTQKSPIVKAEAMNWSSEGIKLFGFGGLQPRVALESIKKGLAESNPSVRTAAISLLAVLHWYMGDTAKRMFEDEKAALKGQIDTECEKYAGQSLPIPSRGSKKKDGSGEAADDEEEEAEAPIEDLVPRQDISAKLNDDLCGKLNDKNWKIRKEGLDELKDIVTSAKFITADLAGLPASLAPRTTDANKILAVQAIELIGNLALAMGPHTKPNIPHLLPPVLAALADSKANVRQAAVKTMNTIMTETSVRDMLVSDIFPSALGKGNPFVKQEIFGWFGANLMGAKVVAKEELMACLSVLFSSLEDRSADVRKAAQEAIIGFMKHLGFPAMAKATEKLSPVTKNTISPLLEKARSELPAPAAKSAPAARARPEETRPQEKRETASAKPGSSKPGAKSRIGAGKPSSASSKKKEEEMDSSPLYQANKLKNTRFRDESKLKSLKWNFATPRVEFVDQLKDQLVAANFNKSLMAMMFHADFKQHLKAIEMLVSHVETDIEGLIANVDLILKWMTLRFFETNPSVNLKGLEYLNMVFNVLSDYDDGYSLHELEATSFIPYLVIKIGDPKDQIRASCKSILRLICKIYPASKLFGFLMVGISTKNAKQRTECLDEIGHLIGTNGTSVAGAKPSDALKEMAKQIADRDTSVRNAALNAITEAYFQEGEKLYKMVGNLPDKDLAMLEERIKRASKTRHVVSLRQPPSQPAQHQASPPPASEAKQSSRPATGMRPPTANSAGSSRDTESDIKMRYQQARAQSAGRAGSQPPRPVSGAFTLDLDKIEGRVGDVRLSMTGPKLVEHNLEDIINDCPVTLPVTRTGMRMTASPEADRSGGNRTLVGNQEAYQAINATIAQVFTTDTQTSISALAELDELMKDNEKVELLENCIDHLFSMCCLQFRHVLQTKMGVDNANSQEIMRQLQYLTMVLMSMYGHREIVTKASMHVLHDLVNIIILILLEPSVPNMPEGAQLVRALNVLTVKIVDRSDHNNVSSALIKLLHECVGNSGLSEKYCVLVMKCIWKVIRGLPTWLEVMDTAALLADLHSFLVSYPASYWKAQEDDTPMRTVKTVIHTIVKVQGETVLGCLHKIPDPQASELLPYIRKLLNNGVGNDSTGSASKPQQATPVSAEKKRMPKFSKSDHEALVEIFKKIGQKELTKMGLQELYNFKQENPQCDLEPFLAQSSQYFRDYIERGLRKIEEEVRQGSRPTVLSDSNPASTGGVGGQPQHLVYLERLKKLRAAGGLAETGNIDQENVENYSARVKAEAGQASTAYSSGVGSGYSSVRSQSGVSYNRYSNMTTTNQNTDNYQEENQNAPQSSMTNVDEIRKRLAKIKAQAF